MEIEKQTYAEWRARYERNNNLMILDDDGARRLAAEGRLQEPITHTEALGLLLICTQVPVPDKT